MSFPYQVDPTRLLCSAILIPRLTCPCGSSWIRSPFEVRGPSERRSSTTWERETGPISRCGAVLCAVHAADVMGRDNMMCIQTCGRDPTASVGRRPPVPPPLPLGSDTADQVTAARRWLTSRRQREGRGPGVSGTPDSGVRLRWSGGRCVGPSETEYVDETPVQDC